MPRKRLAVLQAVLVWDSVLVGHREAESVEEKDVVALVLGLRLLGVEVEEVEAHWETEALELSDTDDLSLAVPRLDTVSVKVLCGVREVLGEAVLQPEDDAELVELCEALASGLTVTVELLRGDALSKAEAVTMVAEGESVARGDRVWLAEPVDVLEAGSEAVGVPESLADNDEEGLRSEDRVPAPSVRVGEAVVVEEREGACCVGVKVAVRKGEREGDASAEAEEDRRELLLGSREP